MKAPIPKANPPRPIAIGLSNKATIKEAGLTTVRQNCKHGRPRGYTGIKVENKMSRKRKRSQHRRLPLQTEEDTMSDEMQNKWGVDYILVDLDRKTGRKNKAGFSADITKQVPGFKLFDLAVSGTVANAMAINQATEYDFSRALFAVGSYIGGDVCLQNLSSSEYSANGRFAFPKAFDNASDKCKAQSVPLPYFVCCKAYTAKDRLELEDNCLRHLHKVLLVALLKGRPFKVLLLEYILGGCGGELSKAFLVRLGGLLVQFHITVIADEILTGARVGPTMCMTTHMPDAFKQVVSHITLGKWLNCALVLVPIPAKPVRMVEQLRGFSTEWNYGPPSAVFGEVVKLLSNGRIQTRRTETLKLMGVQKKVESFWPDHGLLLFTDKTRHPVHQGLKNRVLPRLDKIKLVKLTCKPSEWNRSTVCRQLVASAEDWILGQQSVLESSKFVFLEAVLGFVFHTKRLEFRPEDIMAHIGPKKAEEMAMVVRNRLLEEGRRSTKKPSSFVKQALTTSIINTGRRNEEVIYKKRRGWDRVEYTCVQEAFLFQHKSSQFLS